MLSLPSKRSTQHTHQLRSAFALLLAIGLPIGLQAQDAPRGEIAGQVVVADSLAVQLRVSATGPGTRRGDVLARRFSLRGLAPGTYLVTVSGPLVAPAAAEAIVRGGDIVRVELTLRAAPPRALAEVVVTAVPPVGAIGVLPDVLGTSVYAGKKSEVVLLDSLTANLGQNVTRELVARVPGANISETEGSGFPSNGIGYRGLNPVQSIEMNTRQNGVNIAADIYGYPETYYTPPAEAVERIELVRGSSSLQFGPQFGGVVNYVLRDGAPGQRPQVTIRQSAGSFGAFGTFAGVRGGGQRWVYSAYAQGRLQDGWRPNSDVRQVAAFGRLRYLANERLSLSADVTFFRNRIQMPGGLDDRQFTDDARRSFRARNWLRSPWNIATAALDYRLSPSTRLSSTTAIMFSGRDLVWRNEDGGPGALDELDPSTGAFVAREVESERFRNVTNETRLLTSYGALGATHTLATGIRAFRGRLRRQGGGPGTTGSDFDLSLVGGPYGYDQTFYSTNLSLFAENVFRVGERLLVTPGARFEILRSTSEGYTEESPFTPLARTRRFLLAGLGVQYRVSRVDLYANVTQAYRPIEYSALTPFGTSSRIDPNLRDPRGFNADLGVRGTIGRIVTFDASAFWLAYRNRIGLVSGTDPDGTPFTLRTNIDRSRHCGLEAYVDVKPFGRRAWGEVGLYNSFAYVDARYTRGAFAGNRVEYAPRIVNRAGLTYAAGGFKTTLQVSNTSLQYGDANNTVASADALVGVVPAYSLVDWSARHAFGSWNVSGGVNNLRDARYFTRRTDEYPGPGIIPGLGRSVYLSLAAGF